MIDPFMLAYHVLVDQKTLPPAVYEWFLSCKWPKAHQARMELLMDKSDSGDLTEREREEMTAYSKASEFLTLIRVRAAVSKKTAEGGLSESTAFVAYEKVAARRAASSRSRRGASTVKA